MEAKTIRSGIFSAIILLLTGLIFGSFGGWEPIYRVTDNIFGSAILAVTFSIFLSFVYFNWFRNFLPGSPVIRGALFGILVWIFFLILGGLSNFFKEAVYPQNPGSALFLSLILNTIWGGTLGIFLESKS